MLDFTVLRVRELRLKYLFSTSIFRCRLSADDAIRIISSAYRRMWKLRSPKRTGDVNEESNVLTTSFTSILNRVGERDSPWRTPILILNGSVYPYDVRIFAVAYVYIDLIHSMNFELIPEKLSFFQSRLCVTESKAPERST